MVKKLSELQLELLKVYSFNTTNEDLQEIKKIFAKYFADKLKNNISYDHFKKNKTA